MPKGYPKPKTERKNDLPECTRGKPKPDTYWAPNLKYDDEAHPKMLLEMGKEGEWKTVFCVKAEISGQTFDEWVELYPKFRHAWSIAYEGCKAKMEAVLAAGGDGLSSIQYLYNVRFRPNRIRIRGLSKTKNSQEVLKIAKEHIEQKGAESKDVSALMQIVETSSKVDDLNRLREEVKQLQAQDGINLGTS